MDEAHSALVDWSWNDWHDFKDDDDAITNAKREVQMRGRLGNIQGDLGSESVEESRRLTVLIALDIRAISSNGTCDAGQTEVIAFHCIWKVATVSLEPSNGPAGGSIVGPNGGIAVPSGRIVCLKSTVHGYLKVR
ncbi:MAG: hypothetical protein M1827_000883 [Pycnora praestabilis]|nr:MAG: hypothetical protein M1827_000883 [Pycnora praestabilis]